MLEETKKNEEEIVPITEELNFEKADYTFIPKGIHIYRQEGYYLVCRSCDLGHAVNIGKDKVMVGQNEEGIPLLKKRSEVGMA